MNGYFNNPEVKKSSIVFLAVMLVFMAGNYLILTVNNQSLKRDYIKVMGGVAARIAEKSPELEQEIVPLMIGELSREDEAKGREILKQYGISETLENRLFPHIKDSFRRSLTEIMVSALVLTILLFLLNYIQHGYYYSSMRNFSAAARQIVEGDYALKLDEKREGDLSKLTQAFNSMGEVIRRNIFALKKEKQFLVDILSDISHQLKTPLSTMILYNDIMLAKDLTEEQRETFLKSSQNQLERMRWLILNLLKLAKMDANAIELEIEEQSLNETVEEVVEIMGSKASEEKVHLSFSKEDEISLSHDRLWLQEALINVVKNGIEHAGEGGSVTIELGDNPAFTRITVKNTGEAIQEQDLSNIFKRFYKGKNSKRSDSIGIGLSLAKSIVEKHGGYIEARSTVEEGTSFIMTFLKY